MNIFKEKFFYVVLSLVSFGILLKTYDYLNKLENCDCFNDFQVYHSLKINIDFLKAYQIFEMFLVVMFIVILFFCRTTRFRGNKKVFSLNFLNSSVVLLLAFVTGYISYNVFLLYALSKDKCKCVDKWQKYFIYVQGIMGTLTFMRIIFMLFFTFLLALSTHHS
tara:strand:- start:68 stop:559 length:492 start_codon:yes stop_codon:yes gene_type:complete